VVVACFYGTVTFAWREFEKLLKHFARLTRIISETRTSRIRNRIDNLWTVMFGCFNLWKEPSTRYPLGRFQKEFNPLVIQLNESHFNELKAGRPRFDSREGQRFFFSLRRRVLTSSGAHPASYPMGISDFFLGCKWP
jgi:hypothetical protein